MEEAPILLSDLCKEKHNNDESELTSSVAAVSDGNNKVSSLSMIAMEYDDTESESEDVSNKNELKRTADDVKIIREVIVVDNYRTKDDKTLFSEDSDSDSSTSSSSDSSEESSDSEDSSTSKNSGNDVKKNSSTEQLQRSHKTETRSELDDLPPIEDLKISVPEVLCDPLGEVAWTVEQLVVVRPKPGKPTLNLDTVLFVEKGQRALGRVFDVFGQVSEPYYCVRFNSTDHIEESAIKIGMMVYFCPNSPYTSLVFLHELIKMKGTDAVGEDEPPEFSDDEEERAYYASLKQKQNNDKNKASGDTGHKRKRTSSPSRNWQSNHPWNRNTKTGMHQKQSYHKKDENHVQNELQSSNSWSHSSHYNPNWQSMPRQMHPAQTYGYMPHLNAYQSRPPFGAPPRFCPGPSYRPNMFSPPRFRYPHIPWRAQGPVPPHLNIPWVSSPPPPPPPLPPPEDSQ